MESLSSIDRSTASACSRSAATCALLTSIGSMWITTYTPVCCQTRFSASSITSCTATKSESLGTSAWSDASERPAP